MPKRNARLGFPSARSDSDRALSTFFVSSRSKLLMYQSPSGGKRDPKRRSGEQRAGEAAASPDRALAWLDRRRGKPGRRAGHGVGSRFGLDTGGGGREHGDRRHRFSGTSAPSLGVGVPKASAKISPTYVAYNPSNGDTAVASTQAGSVYVYLIAGGTGSEANEYNIQTAPNPSPAFGSLTSGDAYLVAGTGTAGLIAQPGNNQFGNSTTAVATSNPITPTSVAFDPNGNLLIAGENTNASAIQVVAKTTGTFYGVAMTAGDLYTVADVGVSGAPGTAINMGDLAAPANGMSVDPSGNIVVGDGERSRVRQRAGLGQPQPLRPEHPGPVRCGDRRELRRAAPTALRVPPMTRRRRSTSRAPSPSSTVPTTSTSPTTNPVPDRRL